MNKIFTSCIIALLLTMVASCSSLKEFDRLAQAATPIYYTQLDNYYVRNDVQSNRLTKLIFDTRGDFERYFGEAAVMGDNGQPTAVNWGKQYVIAVILPETSRSTTVTPVEVKQNGNSVILYYHVEKGERGSYNMVPFTAVALDKPADPQGMEFYFIEK